MTDSKKEEQNVHNPDEDNITIKEIQKKLKDVQIPFREVLDKYNKSIFSIITSEPYLNKITVASKTLKSFVPQINSITNQYKEYMNNMLNTINISSIIYEYVNKYQITMREVLKKIKSLPISRINSTDSIMLNKYYWVIPFEYDYLKVRRLAKYRTRIEFEKYMNKYFNNNRTKRLFNKLKKQFKEKDKKELLKQIERSYFQGDYAISITSLMTLFDGATLILVEPNSKNQHSSYKVVDEILKYMNKQPINEYGYELYLKTTILNNFIAKLYENINLLKTSRRKILLSRHINSHGVRYLNNKINVLRLLNALYFFNEVIRETNLQEQFTKDGKKFIKI